jgi:hypothetical protein
MVACRRTASTTVIPRVVGRLGWAGMDQEVVLAHRFPRPVGARRRGRDGHASGEPFARAASDVGQRGSGTVTGSSPDRAGPPGAAGAPAPSAVATLSAIQGR